MSQPLGAPSHGSSAVLWLHSTDRTDSTDNGCGSCHSDSTEADCPAAFDAPRCTQPVLRGDPAKLAHLMTALRTVGDLAQGHNIVDAQHVRALTIGPDEAELTLTFRATCGIHQHIADAAFQLLRRELPDTDIYVLHAP